MKNRISLLTCAIAMSVMANIASAQLFMSGSFALPAPANTVISNAPNSDSFSTGISQGPAPAAGRNAVRFNAITGNAPVAFVPAAPISIGNVVYSNRTNFGAQAFSTNYNLTLNFTGGISVVLNPIVFSLDTAVSGGLGNDQFGAISGLFGQVTIAGDVYDYAISGLSSVFVAEGTATSAPNAVFITFTPIPEPSTYGMIGAAALVGFAVYRRRRAAKVQA
jgi:hypothetical protein